MGHIGGVRLNGRRNLYRGTSSHRRGHPDTGASWPVLSGRCSGDHRLLPVTASERIWMVSGRRDHHCALGRFDLGPLALEFTMGGGNAGWPEHDCQRSNPSDDDFRREAAGSTSGIAAAKHALIVHGAGVEPGTVRF